jgi:hypothetical protein
MGATPKQKQESEKAKKVILQSLAEGMTVEQACRAAGRTLKSYEYYRKDPVFKSLADRTRLGSVEKNFAEETAKGLDFKTWRLKYLKATDLPPSDEPDRRHRRQRPRLAPSFDEVRKGHCR